jgi:anti-sigma factor ChrR (cupin superfamily)
MPNKKMRIVNTAKLRWQPIEKVFEGSEAGHRVRVKVIAVDDTTGRNMVLSDVPAGFRAHEVSTHDIEQELFVLEGDLSDANHKWGAGTYICIPPHTKHGPFSSRKGCRLLFINSGEYSIEHQPVSRQGRKRKINL